MTTALLSKCGGLPRTSVSMKIRMAVMSRCQRPCLAFNFANLASFLFCNFPRPAQRVEKRDVSAAFAVSPISRSSNCSTNPGTGEVPRRGSSVAVETYSIPSLTERGAEPFALAKSNGKRSCSHGAVPPCWKRSPRAGRGQICTRNGDITPRLAEPAPRASTTPLLQKSRSHGASSVATALCRRVGQEITPRRTRANMHEERRHSAVATEEQKPPQPL